MIKITSYISISTLSITICSTVDKRITRYTYWGIFIL